MCGQRQGKRMNVNYPHNKNSHMHAVFILKKKQNNFPLEKIFFSNLTLRILRRELYL